MSDNQKKTIFSGVQPSGKLTLGNYLGAIRNFPILQEQYNCIYCVVDQHAITVRQEPAALRRATLELIAQYIACGLDPEKSILFIQSHVHHKLIDMGFNQKQAVAILYAISATLGLTAVVLTSSGEVKAIVLLLAVLAAILVGACIIYGAEHWSKHAPENKEDKDDE